MLGKAAADAEHQIRFVQEMPAVPGKGAAAGPERQGVVLRKGALAVEIRHDRRLQQLGQSPQFLGGLGIKDALPGEDHRAGGVEQHARRLVDVALVAGRSGDRNLPVLVRIDTHVETVHIGRHFHHDRALSAVLHLSKGAPHDVRDLLGQDHFFDRLGDRGIGTARFEHREQLRRLARVTERQKHHRARIRKGGRDAGEGVLRARPILHREHPRRAAVGDAGEPVGHMDADPLLPADDRLDADRRSGLDDRGGRKAEERRDAFAFQYLGNHVHDEHRWFLPTVVQVPATEPADRRSLALARVNANRRPQSRLCTIYLLRQ